MQRLYPEHEARMPNLVVVLIALAALAAKLYCAATTLGSTDVFNFLQYADHLAKHGLVATYQAIPVFNHPPPVAWLITRTYELAGAGNATTREEGEQALRSFGFLLRTYASLADFIAVAALLYLKRKTGKPAWWAIAIFAAAPAHFAVAGFHGNTDTIVSAAVLLVLVACVVEKPILCGVLMGLACNVKVSPLLLTPLLFLFWLNRKQALRFCVPAALTTLAGWAPALFVAPAVFLKNVLGYQSVFGVWGFTYLIRFTGNPDFKTITFHDYTPGETTVMNVLKVVVIILGCAIPLRFRRTTGLGIFAVAAWVWAAFYFFAPGFAPQYLVWISGALVVASEAWFAAYAIAAGIAAIEFYTVLSQGLPWNLGVHVFFMEHTWGPDWAPSMLLPWGVCGAFFVVCCMRFLREPALLEAGPSVASAAPVQGKKGKQKRQ